MTAPVAVWAATSLTREVRAFLDRATRLPDVARVAVMPDVHVAGDACVGTAIATRTFLYPELLGSDLGCGVAALPLGVTADRARDPAAASRMLRALARAVPTHRGRVESLPDALTSRPLSSPALAAGLRDAALQLGTLGRGNHFLELQEDDDGRLWLMVHTGSRAIGPAVQAHHVALASREAGFPALDASSPRGRAYLSDLEWALDYARENRRRIAHRAAEIAADVIGAQPEMAAWLECHHDAVSAEVHGGEPLWVHRKGAVAAHAGATVLVPGSMGTASYHAVGRGVAESLCTSAHGAGRSLPRAEARRRISPRALADAMRDVAWDTRAARHLVEEAPAAYKDVDRVMRAQRDLVRITRRLRPVLVHKGV